MNQCVEVLKDEFIDYAGKTHHFVIVAISEPICPAMVVREDGTFIETIGEVTKSVRIGVSICNPEDEFNDKVGVLKATYRANNSSIALYSNKRGQINSTVVKAFLVQEAEYLKNNPEKYIKGYIEAKERYEKNLKMKGIETNFTEVERIVVDNLKKDPKFLDNVQDYLKWYNDQNNGKCRKDGN